MFLTAQRVAQGREQGVNAFLYLHNRDISDEDPVALLDAPPGTLQVQMEELPSGGNRIRSFLDLVVPDQATRASIEALLDLFDHRKAPASFPWVLRFGTAAARLHMDMALATVWQEEVEALVELTRACVLSYPGLRVTPRYARGPGMLDPMERDLCTEAATRRDAEPVLSLMRQLARARRLAELGEVIRLSVTARGDARIGSFLAEHVPAILSNYYLPTHGPDLFNRFIEWGLEHPEWAAEVKKAAVSGDGVTLAEYVDRLLRDASGAERS